MTERLSAFQELTYLEENYPAKYREFDLLYFHFDDYYTLNRVIDIPTTKAIVDFLLENDCPLCAQNYLTLLSE